MNAQAEIPPKSDNPTYRLTRDLPSTGAIGELRQIPHWVAWKHFSNNGKWTKVPVNPHTGDNAKVNDPSTWGTYAEARQCQIDRRLAGVGFVLTGNDGFTGGDLDNCYLIDGCTPAWAQDVIDMAETYCEVSQSGHGVRFFASGKIAKSEKSDAAGVELYVGGRWLVITGDHIAGTPDAINPAPRTIGKLQDRIASHKSEKASASAKAKPSARFKIDTGVNTDPFWRAVNEAALASLDQWVTQLFPNAIYHASTGAWRVTSAALGRDLQEDLSFSPKGIEDFGREVKMTAINAVQEWGGAPSARAAALWLCEAMGRDPAALGYKGKASGHGARTGAPSGDTGQTLDLIKDNKGRAVWCAENAGIILEQNPAWTGVFAYDEFGGLTMLQKPLPGSTAPKSSYRPRPIRDSDMTVVLRWFNRNGFPDGNRQTVTDAVEAVARTNTFSPVQDYLHGLAWDGKARAGTWLATYCGAAPSSLTEKQGQAWLISAVARALNPGCKADCALVLEGQQGAGKSSALNVLAGDDWFYDGLHDLHSKDASAGLRGKWIIELPELSAMRRTETEGVKAFLSRTTERYRPAYGRCEVIEARRCVFAGTTNRTDWLTDDTGGRRFWPVALGKVDLQALVRDRDQIWAEAVNLYKGGATWWLAKADEAEAAEVVASRASDDPWSADVLAAADGMAEVSTRDIFQRLEFGKERWGKSESMRVTGILTRAGWKHSGKFWSGPSRGLARYLPPERAQ